MIFSGSSSAGQAEIARNPAGMPDFRDKNDSTGVVLETKKLKSYLPSSHDNLWLGVLNTVF
jgi:hypothetical protein